MATPLATPVSQQSGKCFLDLPIESRTQIYASTLFQYNDGPRGNRPRPYCIYRRHELTIRHSPERPLTPRPQLLYAELDGITNVHICPEILLVCKAVSAEASSLLYASCRFRFIIRTGDDRVLQLLQTAAQRQRLASERLTFNKLVYGVGAINSRLANTTLGTFVAQIGRRNAAHLREVVVTLDNARMVEEKGRWIAALARDHMLYLWKMDVRCPAGCGREGSEAFSALRGIATIRERYRAEGDVDAVRGRRRRILCAEKEDA